MTELQTILGTEIPITTRGIVYFCNFTYRPYKIKVVAERLYDSAGMALEVYANTPNHESQLVTGKTFDELIKELHQLHEDMKSPIWLKELAETL